MRAIIFRWALVAMGVVALWIGGVLWLNSSVYSANRFVENYLEAVGSGELGRAGALSGAADELAALPTTDTTLSEIEVTGTQSLSPTEVLVQADYLLDGEQLRTVFTLQRLPRVLGVFDRWGFAVAPTAEITAGGVGIREIRVNDYLLSASKSHTVLVPGRYVVEAGNQWSATSEQVGVLSTPQDSWQVDLALQPTAALREEVNQAIEEYLQECASRQVLQPASCPFGTEVSDRLNGLPTWTITVLPALEFEQSADGSYWRVSAVGGVATVTGTIQSLFDGSLRPLNRDVPFSTSGEVTNLFQESPALRID